MSPVKLQKHWQHLDTSQRWLQTSSERLGPARAGGFSAASSRKARAAQKRRCLCNAQQSIQYPFFAPKTFIPPPRPSQLFFHPRQLLLPDSFYSAPDAAEQLYPCKFLSGHPIIPAYFPVLACLGCMSFSIPPPLIIFFEVKCSGCRARGTASRFPLSGTLQDVWAKQGFSSGRCFF